MTTAQEKKHVIKIGETLYKVVCWFGVIGDTVEDGIQYLLEYYKAAEAEKPKRKYQRAEDRKGLTPDKDSDGIHPPPSLPDRGAS